MQRSLGHGRTRKSSLSSKWISTRFVRCRGLLWNLLNSLRKSTATARAKNCVRGPQFCLFLEKIDLWAKIILKLSKNDRIRLPDPSFWTNCIINLIFIFPLSPVLTLSRLDTCLCRNSRWTRSTFHSGSSNFMMKGMTIGWISRRAMWACFWGMTRWDGSKSRSGMTLILSWMSGRSIRPGETEFTLTWRLEGFKNVRMKSDFLVDLKLKFLCFFCFFCVFFLFLNLFS